MSSIFLISVILLSDTFYFAKVWVFTKTTDNTFIKKNFLLLAKKIKIKGNLTGKILHFTSCANFTNRFWEAEDRNTNKPIILSKSCKCNALICITPLCSSCTDTCNISCPCWTAFFIRVAVHIFLTGLLTATYTNRNATPLQQIPHHDGGKECGRKWVWEENPTLCVCVYGRVFVCEQYVLNVLTCHWWIFYSQPV